jgi:hypothetical protein
MIEREITADPTNKATAIVLGFIHTFPLPVHAT